MNIIYDIETIKGNFLFVAYHVEEKKWYQFSIWQKENQLIELIRFLELFKDANYIGYNNVNFDGQVIEYIWRNYESFLNLSNLEISSKISLFASDVIHDTNYGKFPPYQESNLTFRQIDLFKIAHYDNKNRRVGLKRLEYEMDMDNIEELPTPVNKEFFTNEENQELIDYCYHDVNATYLFYKHLTGNVEHDSYKEVNQILIREALTDEFKQDFTNYSDSKYGDEIVKLLYCKESGADYKDLPRKGTFRKKLKFKEGIPSYVKFNNPEFKKLLNILKKTELSVENSFEYNVSIDGNNITVGSGGLHNVIENKIYESNDEWVILDADVASYYPATVLNNGYAPKHLNAKAFLRAYKWAFDKRIELKPLSKKDKKIAGIVLGYKNALNSVYGKLGDMQNWLYDPQQRLNICIAGQLSLLMLTEMLHEKGIQTIMQNTDGLSVYCKRSDVDLFYSICNEWIKITNYILEYKEYKSMYFLSVNDYIAIDIDDNVKYKGDFLVTTELHKNKSNRIIPLALKEYFINKKDVTEFVNNYNRIYDFCARSSAGNTFYHATFNKDGTQIKLPKLIRYYTAKKGINIMKMVKEDNTTNAKNTNVKPADKLKCILNKVENEEYHLSNIDRQWYIDEINTIIYRLETGRKPKNIFKDPNQLSMF
jgi:hypothetical protein